MSLWSVNHAVPGVTGIGEKSRCTCHICYTRLRTSLEDLDKGFESVTGPCILFFFKKTTNIICTVAHSTGSLPCMVVYMYLTRPSDDERHLSDAESLL
jgi:hypothetical protein